jgi:DNA-binding transcriptional LysR family regulator
MPEDLNDLAAFAAVAQARSFSHAAAKLNVSPSALSQTIAKLEKRLGLRLLARTTRSVAMTAAGQRLYNTLQPRLTEIAAELAALTQLRDRPSGTLRITTSEHPALTILQPALARLLPQYPDLNIEISVDYGLTDIVADRFDAGIRLGEHLAQDMIAVPISPPFRMAVVAAPSYFKTNPLPQQPADLHAHRCINIRFPRLRNLAQWEFEKAGRVINIRVDAAFVSNSMHLNLAAVHDGLGLAWMPYDLAAPRIKRGELVEVLADWCPHFAGYHLYYPNRSPSPALAVLIEALRFRAVLPNS